MRILVVDDEKNIRRAMAMAIESMDHDVVSVASGTDAFKELRNAAFQVVFLDLKLHQESGLDVLAEILRLAPLKKTTLLLPDHGNLGRYMWELNLKIAEEARVNVLRGLLALEAGNLEHAQRVFRVSLRFWQSPGGMVFPDPESLSCRLIAQQWLAGRGQSLITSPRK